MLRKIIIAAAAVTMLAGTAISANSQARHSGYGYAPYYGSGYSSGERGDPTNTNGVGN
jgi:hypothetical protein